MHSYIAYSSFLYSFIVFCVARADQRVQQFYITIPYCLKLVVIELHVVG